MSTVQSTVFDLDTMDRVTLVKQLPEPPKINSTAEALHFLGNDAKKLLEIIQKGIEVEQREQVKNDPNVPWMVEEESEDGKSTELSPFSGTPANEDKVNGLILSFAKNMFGYAKKMDDDAEKSKAAKRAAKEQAMEMIRNTPAIVARLKVSAAA